MRTLNEEVQDLSEEVRALQEKIAAYGHLPDDLMRLKEMHARAEEERNEAVTKREEAEADVLRQLDANKARCSTSCSRSVRRDLHADETHLSH